MYNRKGRPPKIAWLPEGTVRVFVKGVPYMFTVSPSNGNLVPTAGTRRHLGTDDYEYAKQVVKARLDELPNAAS